MDALSEILSLLNSSATLFASLTTGGDWAIRFPRHDGVKFTAVVRGACWLTVEGVAAPIPLLPGDCYLLTTVATYQLASDLGVEGVDVRDVFANAVDGRAAFGRGDDVRMIGGRFHFEGPHALSLLEGLPPVIHIRANSPHASAIPWMLERLADEVSDSGPGSALMVDHLAHMLFVQVLRAYLASGEELPVGWLGALADPQIGPALNLMHQRPGHRWTLAELTMAVGMSRSAFCALFKARVGVAPLDYLLRWRMQLAAKALRQNTESIADIAFSLGYESESAFGNAFKRVMGQAPKRYQRDACPQNAFSGKENSADRDLITGRYHATTAL